MRGKPKGANLRHDYLRIIPAHAGQTITHQCGGLASTDHPRACGANVASPPSVLNDTGSSPRMRGKLEQLVCTLQHERIIPAHAGQTTGI